MSLEYVDRVNRAIDYIVADPAQPLELEAVAKVACFSPFHFHRIFKAATGETLKQFVKRIRLDRSVALMTHGKGMSLTQIAIECGFGSSSDFSRSFRQRFGVPPSAFDVDVFRAQGRKAMQDALTPNTEDRHLLERLPPGENPDDFRVTLSDIPPRTVAYIRVTHPYEPGNVSGAAERLISWADERGLADGQWLGYMWDDPELVPVDRCRYDVGVVVPHATSVEGEVCLLRFPNMFVAQIEVRGPIDLEQRAIDYMYGTWLPQSRMVPDAQPAFEAWIGRPFEHGNAHFELRMELPVVPASRG